MLLQAMDEIGILPHLPGYGAEIIEKYSFAKSYEPV